MKQQEFLFKEKREAPRFNGPEYNHAVDNKRLTGQLGRIFNCMKSGNWRTLASIESITGDPQSSISAQLRHLRKERFGGHAVNRRRKGEPGSGWYEYQVQPNTQGDTK